MSRKEEIIAAAAAVFARKGFYGASMEDIVRESGLSKGGLYWHFDSKDAIVSAVLDRFFTAEMAEIGEILQSELPIPDKLRRVMGQMMADAEAELALYRNIWLEFYAVASRESAFRERLLGYMNQYIALMEALIQQGIEEGAFRPVDPRRTAMTAMAQFEGLILLWAIKPEMVELTSLSETAVEHLLRSLRHEGGRGS